jgi:hypothetical protein
MFGSVADKIHPHGGVLVDDGFLTIVFLDLHAHGQDADDGDQRESDDGQTDGDFD